MAEQSVAYEDAAKWFERAASLPELSLADRARMNLGAAANHVRAGDFPRALAIYERISTMDDPLVRLEAARRLRGRELALPAGRFEGGRSAGIGAGVVRVADGRPTLPASPRQFRTGTGVRRRGRACRAKSAIGHRARAGPRRSGGAVAHPHDEPVARYHPGTVRNPIGAFGRGLAHGASEPELRGAWCVFAFRRHGQLSGRPARRPGQRRRPTCGARPKPPDNPSSVSSVHASSKR